MAFDEYIINETSSGAITVTGPDGKVINTIPSGIDNTAFVDLFPPRQFRNIQAATSVQVDNPNEHAILLPDSNLYIPPRISGFRANLPREVVQAQLQMRNDSIIWYINPGGETSVVRFLDTSSDYSPGVPTQNLTSAQLITAGYSVPSASDDGQGFNRVGLSTAIGYDNEGVGDGAYTPDRTPNVYASNVGTNLALGWNYLSVYTAPANTYWYLLQYELSVEYNGTGCPQGARILYLIQEGGSSGVSRTNAITLKRDAAAATFYVEKTMKGAGMKANSAASLLTFGIYADNITNGPTGRVSCGLYVGG